MCPCVYIHISLLVYVCPCSSATTMATRQIHTYTDRYLHMRRHIHICTHKHTNAYTHKVMNTYMNTVTLKNTRIHTISHIHKCIHTYMQSDTDTHIHIGRYTSTQKDIYTVTYCCGLQIRPVEEQLKQRVIGKRYCISIGSLVRSGNYCCSSIRVASIEENKTAIER